MLTNSCTYHVSATICWKWCSGFAVWRSVSCCRSSYVSDIIFFLRIGGQRRQLQESCFAIWTFCVLKAPSKMIRVSHTIFFLIVPLGGQRRHEHPIARSPRRGRPTAYLVGSWISSRLLANTYHVSATVAENDAQAYGIPQEKCFNVWCSVLCCRSFFCFDHRRPKTLRTPDREITSSRSADSMPVPDHRVSATACQKWGMYESCFSICTFCVL